MTDILRTYSVAEVAEATGQTERYVSDRCRLREWPHRRGAKSGPKAAPRFTADDLAQILELMATPVEQSPPPRFAFAPRSRRSA